MSILACIFRRETPVGIGQIDMLVEEPRPSTGILNRSADVIDDELEHAHSYLDWLEEETRKTLVSIGAFEAALVALEAGYDRPNDAPAALAAE